MDLYYNIKKIHQMNNISIEELQVFLYFIHQQQRFCKVSTDKLLDYIKFRLYNVPTKDVYDGKLLENRDILSFILDHIMCNHYERFGDFHGCYYCKAFRPLVDRILICGKKLDKNR